MDILDKLIPIADKRKIRWLEENTTPLLNVLPVDLYRDEKLREKLLDLTRWEFRFGLNVSYTQRALKTKLSKLLGAKWSYCVNYEFQNAVWGFEFEGKGVVVYFSKDGTVFQVEPGIEIECLLELIDNFYDRLFNTPLRRPRRARKKVATSTAKKNTKRGRPSKDK